jgi:hypothetical protein
MPFDLKPKAMTSLPLREPWLMSSTTGLRQI